MALRHTVLFVAAAFATTGCGIKKDVPLELKFVFASETELCRTESKTVDLTTEADFQENKDLIKNVIVNDLTFTVTNPNVSGESLATKADGSAAGAPVGSSEQFVLGAAPITLEQGATQTIIPDPTSGKRLSKLILSEDSKFDVIGTACANKVPFAFETELVINITVEAGLF